jgi:copper oxidase (laccase) domain-containing protein
MKKSLEPKIHNTGKFSIIFSTKTDGNMLRTNETRVAVHANRLRFLQKHQIHEDSLFTIRTSHSPNVEIVEKEPAAYIRHTYLQRPLIDADFDHYYAGSDGALSFNRDLFIGLMSGDCVPVIIWDNVSGIHGILHVGLLGALNCMVQILPRIYAATGVCISDTQYYLGPSITQRNYNVSNSGLWRVIAPQAHAKVPSIRDYLTREVDGEHFNVQGMIVAQLQQAGVKAEQIQQYAHCVADHDSLFFSHNILKQDGQRGNFFSLIGTRGDI